MSEQKVGVVRHKIVDVVNPEPDARGAMELCATERGLAHREI